MLFEFDFYVEIWYMYEYGFIYIFQYLSYCIYVKFTFFIHVDSFCYFFNLN